jgi:hypothetical protein
MGITLDLIREKIDLLGSLNEKKLICETTSMMKALIEWLISAEREKEQNAIVKI